MLRKNTSAFLIFLAFSLLLFLFLRQKILFTPDYGLSDAYHFFLSVKFFLAENLKHGRIPFWTDSLQGGYPLFSEGQIGALFIPNILFLTFLPFSDGYILLFVFAILCLSFGFFLFLKESKVKPLIAFFFSFMFAFNGAISLRWIHLSLVQSFSLCPLLFFSLLKYKNTKELKYVFLFLFLFSQAVFAGYILIVFILLPGLMVWYLFLPPFKPANIQHLVKRFMTISFLILSGIIISLPQILPSYLLTKFAARSLQIDYDATTAFPFGWKDFISFVYPSFFGNPKYGTYPPLTGNQGIFWENTPFLGYIFLLFFLVPFIFSFSSFKKNKLLVFNFSLTILYILLSLGRNSPLFFIFYIFPFNVLRVPSKYLLMENFFLIFSVTLLFNDFYRKVKKRIWKSVWIILFTVNICSLLFFTFSYHLFMDKDKVLSPPQSASYLDNSLYITLDQADSWNTAFYKGWDTQKKIDNYLFFKNFLGANSNLMYNKKNFDIYTTLHLNKESEIFFFITEQLEKKNETLSLSENGINLTDAVGITTFITPIKLANKEFKEVKAITKGKYTIYIYRKINPPNSFFYVPEIIHKITDDSEFAELIGKNQISQKESAIQIVSSLEIAEPEIKNNTMYKIKKTFASDYLNTLEGTFEKNTYLIFRKNYYPEWGVYVDNKKVPMLTANLIHIGVVIPKGNHTVELRFENTYFKLGVLAAVLYFVVLATVIKKTRIL